MGTEEESSIVARIEAKWEELNKVMDEYDELVNLCPHPKEKVGEMFLGGLGCGVCGELLDE